MESISQKFDLMSQPIETGSTMDINFDDASRKQSISQQGLKSSNIVDEPSTSSYYGCDEAPQSSIEDDRLSILESNDSFQRHTDEFERSFDGKENSNVDVKVMFDKYKEWGIELEKNLKYLGDKITLQKNELSHFNRDYEFFSKQRENNKKSLVELQIQLENLDISKQRVINECEIDKKNKSENVGHLFQSLFANDEYIKETQQKFKEVLQNDKNKFECLLKEIKLEIENHNKCSENYSQEMHALFEKYENSFNNLCEDELNIDFNIESVIRDCQKRKQEKEAKEFEVKNSSANLQNLNDQINQLNDQIETLQNEFIKNQEETDNLGKQNSDLLNEIQCTERIADEKYKSVCKAAKIKNEEKIEYENFVKEITDENSKCASYFENILQEKLTLASVINEKEVNISTLNKETETLLNCHSLTKELNELKQRGEYLLDRQDTIENEITFKSKYNDEIKALIQDNENKINDLLNELEHEKQLICQLETDSNNANQELESSKLKLIPSDFSDKNDMSEKHVNEVENSLKIHKEKLIELENNMNDIENEYSNILSEFEVTSKELEDLDEKEKDILLKRQENCENLQKLTDLKDDFTNLEENYNKLLNSETEINLDELNEELKVVINENKHQEDAKTTQLYAISDSFRFQVQSLNDQMRALKTEKDESIKMKIAHNARYRKAIPKLDEEVKSAEKSISENMKSIFECIDFRLEYISKLMEVYEEASLNMKNSEVKVFVQSIEKELSNSMKYMNVIHDGPKIVASDSLSKYQHIFCNVKKKYEDLVIHFNTSQSKETVEKLSELTMAIYGGLNLSNKPSSSDITASSQITISSDEITSK
ncbi:hypothetical protein O3M35_013237 [Rhynocoris fuscipes]|uniref:Uncharacterized protein n=1 Tax=Rhynocoris fuscipes TaxID=488301 RepID=A0AAW1CEJ0_9HEMI